MHQQASSSAMSLPQQAAVAAAPPTLEDLVALYRLCGGDKLEVVYFLANLWRVDPDSIGPTVVSWLADMPPVELPSRSRSAPPVLPPALRERLASASLRAGPLLPRSYGHQRRPKVPALTAPVAGSQASFAAVLAGLYEASTRLNSHLNRGGTEQGSGGASGSSDVFTLPASGPAFQPVLLTAAQVAAVPEDGVFEEEEDEVLSAYMQRSRVKQGKLKPSVRGAYGKYAGMRF